MIKNIPVVFGGDIAFVKLFSGVRNEGDLSCSLDSCCQLSLMISAAARNAAGQDLSALGHALSELSNVLVINEFGSVNAELAYLFSGTLNGMSGSFKLFSHDTEPPL